MLEIINNASFSHFMPHGHCYLWNPYLVGLHIISDLLTAISYYSIPLMLVYFVRQRRDIPFSWIFLLFGCFIVACGTTHLMEIWTLWHPNYWIAGLIKAITALISCYTALELINLIPQALSLPSPAQLETANKELESQIQERINAEEALQKAKLELELRVQNRTLALKQLNEQMVVQILQRHQAQEELEESNRQIVRILESITEAFFALDRNWAFTYINKQAERILHRKKQYLLNQNIWAEFPEAVGSLFYEQYHLAISAKIPVIFESYYQPLNAWFEVRAYPYNEGLSVFFRDITEQKRNREALARSEELYRTLARNFPNGAIFLFDSDLRYTLVEGTELNAVGLSKNDIEGKTLPEVFGTEIAERIAPFHYDALRGNSSIFEETYENRIYLGHCIPVRNEHGQVFAGLCMTQNITERKKAMEALRQSERQKTELVEKLRNKATELESTLQELRQTQSQLIQAEKMSSIGQLVAGVAHEINNPVSFIYGNVQPAKQYMEDLLFILSLYQKHYPNPPAEIVQELEVIDLDFLKKDLEKLLSSMKFGAERICKIVESLRNFSRHDESDYKTVDIHEGIENTLFILQSRLKGQFSHSEISVIKNYEKIPPIQCYASQINQVFMHLLSNSVDAIHQSFKMGQLSWPTSLEETSHNAGEIRISTKYLENERVIISISDNGPGINPELQSRIFDPFFTTKPIGSGTGLGLSVSYQIIVEKHQGTLECISTPGQGAEFIIEIPLRQNTPRPMKFSTARLLKASPVS